MKKNRKGIENLTEMLKEMIREGEERKKGGSGKKGSGKKERRCPSCEVILGRGNVPYSCKSCGLKTHRSCLRGMVCTKCTKYPPAYLPNCPIVFLWTGKGKGINWQVCYDEGFNYYDTTL